ncbi:Re/Si-specific NAD(P)(+) transhydrogenase subunit alpha [Herbaspirillum sp. DW155]|uniref:Re/Si-specific NAD(P)(+) transhydrogenase subunit alpha n=1 Tax=Herbaspirillum sp. DW155 TaxID=3095609 RepID=UPI003086432C|nr:Re/Si-specific NAD(P)(+) transhydrogenase subunit alpha [Herbaspirillum sp. DW155]
MALTVGIPKEIFPEEKRVAASPEMVTKLIALGFPVLIETQAGTPASMPDEAFHAAGATIAASPQQVWQEADLIFKVRAPSLAEVALMKKGATLISFIWPAQNAELMTALAARRATVLAMDCIPRISRAQKCDALSSMANIAGYRAVIEAANHFGRFFTGQITAAGKVPPAKVFVIGAGVAGLAALGTSVSLGAVVRANDTRQEVADQIKSMGAEFVGVNYEEEGSGGGGYARVMSEGYQQAQRQVFAGQAKDIDIIITTALVPGKPAPKLITDEMVQSMRPGSVIVDLAAEQGGNCALTVPGQVVVRHDVTIIGYTDLPSRLARQSSTLYATNLLRLTEELCKAKDGTLLVNMEDDMIRGATVLKDGTVTWPPPAIKPAAAPAKPAASPPATAPQATTAAVKKPASRWGPLIFGGVAAVLLWLVGSYAPTEFLEHFTVFILACFVGYMVVWNVTASLHTPLMSVTNAISSIIAIGAMTQVSPALGSSGTPASYLLFALAIAGIVLTAVNMFGGFAVTGRMLAMFRKQG